MSLFKFGECQVCKEKCNDAKLTLHHLLPANVCEKISEYNNPCECPRIQMLREKENKFMKEENHKHLTTGEKQILFFKEYMNPPIKVRKPHELMNNKELHEMKNEVDTMIDNEVFKRELADGNMKITRLAIKSFMKKNLTLVNQIISECHLADNVRTCCLFDRGTFRFRNIEFPIHVLTHTFLHEYVTQLIGIDKVYCGDEGIYEWWSRFCNPHFHP